MSADIKIPTVGESITSGQISTWHKEEGETVALGDVLLTLETDKVSTEITAEAPGRLRIKVPAGQEVKIGEVVGFIDAVEGAKADSAPKAEAPAAVAPLSSPPAQTPAPAHTSATPTVPVESASKRENAPPATPEAKAPPQAAEKSATPAPVAPKPVLKGAAQAEAVPSTSAAESTAASSQGRTTRKRLSPIRRKIAAQLVGAQHTAAILTTFNECDMSAVMKLRSELQDAFVKEYGLKLGFMSFFVKAAVSALQSVPAINSRMEGDDLVENHFYDVGVAVGTEKGLVVPVIRGAEQKSFAQIERDIAEYAGRAREGKLKIEDLTGGVFTISNGGIYGSLLSTPILNAPQSGILGMHKIQERAVVEKGQIVARPMMYLALSYDHRVVDGKDAVTFLIRIKDSIENPARLMLGI